MLTVENNWRRNKERENAGKKVVFVKTNEKADSMHTCLTIISFEEDYTNLKISFSVACVVSMNLLTISERIHSNCITHELYGVHSDAAEHSTDCKFVLYPR